MPDAPQRPIRNLELELERARALDRFEQTVARLVQLEPELARLCNPASSAKAGSGVPGAEPPAPRSGSRGIGL